MIDRMADDSKLTQYITARDLKNIKKMLRDFTQVNINNREILYGLQTPLMRICHCNFSATDTLELINAMVLRHYDVNIQDGDGRSLLSHACISQNTDIVELLSDEKICYCNPNLPDNEGNTPLFYAVRSRTPVLVDTFLKCFTRNSLDVLHRNSKGLTALEEAEMKCDREICHLLKQVSKANLSSQVKQVPNVQSLNIKRSPTPDFDHTPQDRRPTRLPSDDISPLVKSNKQHPLHERQLKTRKKNRQDKQHFEEDNDDDSDVFEDNRVKTRHGIHKRTGLTPRERKNSFSLPDLSANNGSLVSSSPSSASGKSDCTNPLMTSSPAGSAPGLDGEVENINTVSRTQCKQSNRKASMSLPELRIEDHVVPNGILVERKPGNVYITSLTPRKPQNTPRSGHSQDLIHNSYTTTEYGHQSMMRPSQGNVSTDRYDNNWNKSSKNGLTLPQIDTTPRTGYPSPRSPRKSHVPYH